MKKVIFGMIAFAATMVACTSNEDVTKATSTEVATAASYVSENFPDVAVVSTASTSNTLTATLATGETVTMSKTGSLIAYSNNAGIGLKCDSLIVKDSIDARGHHRGGHGRPGMPDRNGMRPGHPRHNPNELPIDSLPSVINDYILTNYAGYFVIHAQTDTLCSGVMTAVMICAKEKEPVKLLFNSNGNFVMSGARALSASFPDAVLSAVTKNYADYNLRKRGTIFTLANNTNQYKVFLAKPGAHLSVLYNADGTVVCTNTK